MIIITGASGGIGKAVIPHLLKIDSVMGLYNRSKPDPSKRGRLAYEKVDLEKPSEIASFAEKCKKRLSRITLVNAAAVKIDALTANYAEGDWDRVMNVNLKGDFLLAQALLPYMVRERWGRVIHLSSLGGIQGCAGTAAYSASKAGVLGLSRVLAKEYARFGITSNVLILGHFETGLFEKLQKSEKKRLVEQIPSKRLGHPEEIATAVDFLIKSGYVNGAAINMDGGI